MFYFAMHHFCGILQQVYTCMHIGALKSMHVHVILFAQRKRGLVKYSEVAANELAGFGKLYRVKSCNFGHHVNLDIHRQHWKFR